MRILTKSLATAILAVFAASSALFAQSGASSSGEPRNQASALNAREIVELSVAATERSWQVRDHYTYTERDEDRRLDSRGMVKSENSAVSKMTLVNGARFEQIVEHNGHAPSPEEQQRSEGDLNKLKNETPAERTVRLDQDEANRSFLRDVLGAFDFRLIGEEIVEGRPAYVLQATPHPGYRAHGRYATILSKVEGKLWVDKQDFGWIRVDGRVTQAFSMGLFVARVQRDSHVILDEMCVGDGVWVPKRVEVRASLRILFLKGLYIDRIITYSDYQRPAEGTYSSVE